MGPPSAGQPADLEAVGRIQDAWGIRGWLKLVPYGDPRQSVLLHARRWWLRPVAQQGAAVVRPGDRSPSPSLRAMTVRQARTHAATIVAQLEEVPDRNAAEALRGQEVLVSRADFPATDPDEYYWVDLVGCMVVNREGVALGEVLAVDDHGAHALLRVRPPQPETGAERGVDFLLPFVAAHVDRVDLQARRIDVDWQADYL